MRIDQHELLIHTLGLACLHTATKQSTHIPIQILFSICSSTSCISNIIANIHKLTCLLDCPLLHLQLLRRSLLQVLPSAQLAVFTTVATPSPRPPAVQTTTTWLQLRKLQEKKQKLKTRTR